MYFRWQGQCDDDGVLDNSVFGSSGINICLVFLQEHDEEF